MREEQENIRKEMQEIRQELKSTLAELLREYGSKLKTDERRGIEKEVDELDTLLDRIESGYVWLALFGKTSVGKSAIANSLIGDDVASVHIETDHTKTPEAYRKDPWMIVDVPGIMGSEVLEEIALAEARKALGLIYVVDGEPYGPELKLFDLIHSQFPDKPKLVFINKMDVLEIANTAEECEVVRKRVYEKMRRYVLTDKDIIYGSAQKKVGDQKVRQALPQLEERLYEGAGTLGAVLNVLDPAKRASDLTANVRNKVFEVRRQVARRFISIFGTLSIAGGFVPFAQLVVTPSVLVSMVWTVYKIMGHPISKTEAKGITIQILKAGGLVLAADFGVGLALDVISGLAVVMMPIFAIPILTASAIAGIGGIGYWRYRRTVILGEATLEYIRDGGHWEGKDQRAIFESCKKRAENQYMKLKKGEQE